MNRSQYMVATAGLVHPQRLRAFAVGAVLLLFAVGAIGATPAAEQEAELVIYAYDSFVAEWGPAPIVVPRFEEKHGVTVTVISVGDAGQVLNRAILERENPQADIVLGIDNNMLSRALEEKVLEPYRSPNLDHVQKELIFDPTNSVTPFDYGYFAFVYDSERLENPPRSLEELTESRFRKRIIIQDPRTSSPGLGFLLWTIAVYGEEYLEYWKRLQPNLLTITDGWDTAYGMFTSGEAPMVLSYTTSPAYHVEYEQSERYRALLFNEGNYLQIEGMGILKGAPHPELARRFIDFILTEEFQEAIPLTNWMYPVSPSAATPDSFRFAPKPERTLQLPADEIRKNQERWINAWVKLVSR
ncbi:MAG: thiamine ABC transporter substrate-binding protein [Spirochaetaceae bacterium]|nr:MAG: thiamine ABC transporter substrate-binding protein [Spirochaetaceae bacterium]